MPFQYQQYDLVFLHMLNFTLKIVSIDVKALFVHVHSSLKEFTVLMKRTEKTWIVFFC